jgi:hypothetical protein
MKMLRAAAALAAILVAVPASAEPIVVDPTSDGSLYVCPGCNVVSDDAYVLVSGYIQGAIKFSASPITNPISQAFLTLNPYGLPLFGPSVDIYGYGTTEGQLVESDADAGAYLGTLLLPPDLGFGQDVFFDVTSFLTAVSAPYIAFNLRSDGTDVFSSLEYNYGHPSQLIVTFASTVTEPTGWALLLTAGLLLMVLRRSSPRRASMSSVATKAI